MRVPLVKWESQKSTAVLDLDLSDDAGGPGLLCGADGGLEDGVDAAVLLGGALVVTVRAHLDRRVATSGRLHRQGVLLSQRCKKKVIGLDKQVANRVLQTEWLANTKRQNELFLRFG